jgi:hypothetical protein
VLGAGSVRRGIAVTAIAALTGLAVGCGDTSSSSDEDAAPFPVYDWVPSGSIDPGPGDAGPCRQVLLVGDSLAGETAASLRQAYDDHGYCAEVIDTAVSGTAPASYHPSGTWTEVFRLQLATAAPDFVVSFFTGNGGARLQPANFDETEAMIALARQDDVPIYWVLPPLSAYPCDWDAPLRQEGYRTYRKWVMEHLPGEVPTIDGNVLTPEADADSGLEGYNDSLRVDDEERVVRDFDCVHLRDAGAALVAYEIVYSTGDEWRAEG